MLDAGEDRRGRTVAVVCTEFNPVEGVWSHLKRSLANRSKISSPNADSSTGRPRLHQFPEEVTVKARPRTARSDVPPSSAHAMKTDSASSPKAEAAQTWKRLPFVAVLTCTLSLRESSVSEHIFAMTVGTVSKVVALFSTQASRKRPPGSGVRAGLERLKSRGWPAVTLVISSLSPFGS